MIVRGIGCGLVISLLLTKSLLGGPGINFIENKGQWPQRFDFTAKTPGALFGVGAGTFSYTFIDQQQIEAQHLGKHGQYKESPPNESSMINGYVVAASFLGSNSSSE